MFVVGQIFCKISYVINCILYKLRETFYEVVFILLRSLINKEADLLEEWGIQQINLRNIHSIFGVFAQ